MTANDMILALNVVGSRGGATRVCVQAPQGSCFDGLTGTIARVRDDTAMVRLDRGGPDLPFALGELVALPTKGAPR